MKKSQILSARYQTPKTQNPKPSTQISILGCGWLGLPLAKSLISKGFSVNGSTTSAEKMTVLENEGIIPFHISVSENKTEGDILGFLKDTEILIIDIPPKLRTVLATDKMIFVEKIKNLIPFIEKSSVEKIIFVSSTSVYGKNNGIITEKTITNPDTESGKQLVVVENLLLNNKKFKTTVIRFGGLIGENRNPATFLAGKKDIESPNAPINLIHQEDCIGIINKIVELNVWNEIFNAVSPFHPKKQDYYCKKALEMNLKLPEFNHLKTSNNKTIDSSKIINLLSYKFKFTENL